MSDSVKDFDIIILLTALLLCELPLALVTDKVNFTTPNPAQCKTTFRAFKVIISKVIINVFNWIYYLLVKLQFTSISVQTQIVFVKK